MAKQTMTHAEMEVAYAIKILDSHLTELQKFCKHYDDKITELKRGSRLGDKSAEAETAKQEVFRDWFRDRIKAVMLTKDSLTAKLP